MYIAGIDVGGTFTDCVVVDDDGRVSMDKAFTTPGDLSQGILASVTNACTSLGKSVESLLAETRVLALGTTSLTNRVVARTGARIGLLTTRGHEDAVLIGRLLSRTDGLRETERYDVSAWNKPEPMVIRKAIKGISERVDSRGEVVVSLDQEAVKRAVGELEALGVESVAVVFLWSFLNPTHERMARSIIRECAPHISVSLSCEVAPTLGEYERATTTILNAFLAPGARQDLEVMEARLRERGLKHRLLVMQSHGGFGWSEEIERVPIKALAAGPVGGVMGAAKLASFSGYQNAICTDMGGTSFDVGLVIDGQPRFANESIIERYRIRVPTVEITSHSAKNSLGLKINLKKFKGSDGTPWEGRPCVCHMSR